MQRILIIDDTQAIHDDFRKILADHGPGSASLSKTKAALFGGDAPEKAQRPRFDVECAHQGEEGWEKLRAAVGQGRPFALAFVDMRMPPGWDGLQTIQRLWEADPELQVVICTAYSDHSWDEISEKLGLNDRLLILKKPFDPIEVTQLASALCEKWKLKRQATLKFDELERLVQQRTTALAHDAMHDRLTGLPNRSMLRERLARLMGRQDADGTFALFFLDFDRFKVVNDSLGHDAGDRLLEEIGRRIVACLGSEVCTSRCRDSLAARMGGDEFVVLLEGLRDVQEAGLIAGSLLEALASPYTLGSYNLTTTASIGITTGEMGYENPDDVLRDADTAMYHAKAAGKARHVVFDRRMHQEMRDRLTLENELRATVAQNGLTLFYQPVVCIATGGLKGFEALVRWNHPTRGLVTPDRFIACAEETGLILPLGEWVLKQACRQLGEWRRCRGGGKDLLISVNVSAKQLASPRLLEQVESAVKEAGIAPEQLALEITETAVIAEPEFTIDLLHRIKKLGVRVYMDDFGTGYSSLSYLHRLPLDCLKMDRSFMQSVVERRDYAAIVHAIIMLAQNLGIGVIAEGVENTEQLVMLQSMECNFAQGYLFGRPCGPDDVEPYWTRPWMPKAA